MTTRMDGKFAIGGMTENSPVKVLGVSLHIGDHRNCRIEVQISRSADMSVVRIYMGKRGDIKFALQRRTPIVRQRPAV